MIMAKGQAAEEEVPNEDNVLVQLESMEQHKTSHKQTVRQGTDDFDVAGVDDLMKKYDENEKKEKQNEDFVNVLNKDEKIRSFFLQNYNPGMDQADDERFISYEFSKYSEQGWSEDGKPLDKKVLSKKKARKFANEIVQKWKGYDAE